MMKCTLAFAAAALLGSSGLQPALAQSPDPQMATVASAASPRIMMLRLYVGDIARAEHFYHMVFGASPVQKMGDHVRIMMFPGNSLPGIILIQSPEVATMHGSFVIQVANLKATLDAAEANGGQLQNTHFSNEEAGMPAQSSHFVDPEGNLIEVLQMGGAKKP